MPRKQEKLNVDARAVQEGSEADILRMIENRRDKISELLREIDEKQQEARSLSMEIYQIISLRQIVVNKPRQ